MARLFAFLALAASLNAFALRVQVGQSELVSVPDLKRVAVASGHIVKARAVPPSSLLITGIKRGRTTVTTWNERGVARKWFVDVVAPEFPQIARISLQFLEASTLESQQLGVKWPEAIQATGGVVWQGGVDSSGLNYSVTLSSAKALLQQMLQEGTARILARPELYVRLGEEAVFHSGGELPVSTSSENYGRYHRHVEWKPYGLTVKVRPQSQDGYHISSDVNVEISELNSAVEMEGVPALLKRTVDTKMDAIDRKPVILSGLLKQANRESKTRVPVLSQVPIVGPLFFSHESRREDETEILLVMTLTLSDRFPSERREEEMREKWQMP